MWAVATPYMRNSDFELQDDKLIIYDGDAYIYNSKTGEFLGLDSEEKLLLDYGSGNECPEKYEENQFYFDTHQVYQADSNGELQTIVLRPWWHWLFDFEVCMCITLLGAMGIGALLFVERANSYIKVKNTVQFKNHKAKVIKNYYKVTSIVQLSYAFLNIIFGFFGGILCIGIAPLAIHLIVSSVITENMAAKIPLDNDEKAVMQFWLLVKILSFVIAFFSVIIVVAIAE